VCGGSGQVRDMFVIGRGAQAQVVAVGDGVASFDPGTGRWQSQIGTDLSGLNSLYVSGAPHWWAVGERDRIARYEPDTGCWRAEDEARLIGSVNLTSVMVGQTAPGGWSVGAVGGRGLLLRLAYVDGEPVWLTVSEDRTGPLPPLADLHVFDSSDVVNDAWMVSPVSGQAMHASLGTDVAGTGSVVEILDTIDLTDERGQPATPLEIAMASPTRGWIAGETDQGAVVAWRYVGALDWAVELVAQGQRLLDLYQDESRTWWLGMTPGPRLDSVVRYNRRADGQGLWQAADRRPPAGAGAEDAGSKAVAPLDDGRVLYAYGDGVWAHELGDLHWHDVRTRRRIVGVAPNRDGTGGWAVADAPGDGPAASELLVVSGLGLRPVATDAAPSPRLNAVDGAAGVWWAVGDGGESMTTDGSIGAWRPAPRISSTDRLVDVAVGLDGVAWAAAETVAGGGRLYWFDASIGAWEVAADSTSPLVAVAALEGRAWAVGAGTVCECLGVRCACDEELTLGGQPLPLTAVAAAEGHGSSDGPGEMGSDGTSRVEVWAAGAYLILQRGPDGWRPRDARGVSGIPRGAAITDLAAGDVDDLWVVATCNPYGEEGRGVSLINHVSEPHAAAGERVVSRLSTAFSVPVHDVRVRAGSDGASSERVVWVAGDWSTVARLRYRPGDAVDAAQGEDGAFTDLWCLPSDAELP